MKCVSLLEDETDMTPRTEFTHEDLRNLVIAGKIAKFALEKVCSQVKQGVKISNLYDYAVKLITSKEGVKLAFPPNISINECAAHDTAGINDNRSIPQNGYIKIDLGANVNGMLSDTAKTVAVGSVNSRLIRASKDALDAAIETIKPGVHARKIGQAIQETIEGYGFKPIANLTGHQIKKGNLHAGFSIPNVNTFTARGKVQVGMILAIEPFATNGSRGYIKEGSAPLIFSATKPSKTKLGKIIFEKYGKLPFSARDASKLFSSKNSYEEIRELVKSDSFHSYAPLVEISGGMVSQREHTVFVQKKETKIIT